MEKFTDETLMPFGFYKGKKLAKVPPDYLLYIYENYTLGKELKKYIKDNLDVIKSQINYQNKSK